MEDLDLSIETTDYCNLNCIMCLPQNWRKDHLIPYRGNLSFQTFKSIIDSIKNNNILINNLFLYWLGEPFLTPYYLEMLDYTIKFISNQCNSIRISTNLNALKQAQLDKLLQISTIKVLITVSLDASKPRTYEKIRRNGNFEDVIRNMEYIINHRKHGPIMNPQFIILPENYKETQGFLNLCFKLLQKGDMIFIKRESYNQDREAHQNSSNLYNTTIKSLNLKTGYYNGIYLNISEETDWGSKE
jgi:MoaA/NifB/PqqE/SkfB family radical SAM enzyme